MRPLALVPRFAQPGVDSGGWINHLNGKNLVRWRERGLAYPGLTLPRSV
jgi:hypothetical protein